MSAATEVELLWRELDRLERGARFSGRSYPTGIESFPHRLSGQGFFPGGDGLWRDEDAASLRSSSPYPFPVGGILFLGNDFGSLDGYRRLKGYENPPTWRWLRRRLELAGVPGHRGFFSNAYLGLRTDRKALGPGLRDAAYSAFCAEFLELQLQQLRPSLVVTLGRPPAALLRDVIRFAPSAAAVQRGRHGDREVAVLVASHPYGDLGKTPERRAEEAEVLRAAWAEMQARIAPAT